MFQIDKQTRIYEILSIFKLILPTFENVWERDNPSRLTEMFQIDKQTSTYEILTTSELILPTLENVRRRALLRPCFWHVIESHSLQVIPSVR